MTNTILSIMAALFIDLNEPCNALPADIMKVYGEDFLIMNYECGSRAFKVWHRDCKGHFYPVMLRETRSGQTFYIDRAGTLRLDLGEADVSTTYRPGECTT